MKRNAVMAKVPEDTLRIDAGATYTWNSMRAEHRFCRRCGIYMFHRKRAAPDRFGINIFCLDGFDAEALPVRPTEGVATTVVCDRPREEWAGPRVAIETER